MIRYAAIGDSFTEGLGDDLPDGNSRGWADLVAAGLAAGTGQPVDYANLAIRGRLLDPIVRDQLPAALGLSPPPTLLTFNGGGNDMMRPGGDMPRLVELTDQAARACAAAGVRMVLLSGADPSDHLPFGGVIRRRGEQLTEAIGGIVERHGLTFVDVFHDREIRRAGYWSADRLHLNAAGHRRVAGLVLTALGHPTAAHLIDPGPDPRRWAWTEARYYGRHVLPWVQRRLRGRSSGDHRTGKYLGWTRVEATADSP